MISADEIADGVVELLNTLETSIAFQADNPPLIAEIEREVDDATVQVYPFDESEQASDRADMLRAVRVVAVVVQAPLRSDRTRANCLAWLNEIKDAFREQTIEGYRWRGNESDTLCDYPALKTKSQFVSVFKATFESFV